LILPEREASIAASILFTVEGNRSFVDAIVNSLSCVMERVWRFPGDDLIRIAPFRGLLLVTLGDGLSMVD